LNLAVEGGKGGPPGTRGNRRRGGRKGKIRDVLAKSLGTRGGGEKKKEKRCKFAVRGGGILNTGGKETADLCHKKKKKGGFISRIIGDEGKS